MDSIIGVASLLTPPRKAGGHAGGASPQNADMQEHTFDEAVEALVELFELRGILRHFSRARRWARKTAMVGQKFGYSAWSRT